MKYTILLISFFGALVCRGQFQFDTDDYPDYYYEKLIDNPDTNQAKLFVNLKILNAFVHFVDGRNTGIFPGIQVIYTPDKKKWGTELNYDNSLFTGEDAFFLSNGFFELSGFYMLNFKAKEYEEQIRVNQYYSGYNTKVNEVIKVPITQHVSKGIRTGVTFDRNFINNVRYSNTGFFVGYTKQKNDRSYIRTVKRGGGVVSTHDYSSWIIYNFDFFYYTNFSPDPRENRRFEEYKGQFPFGFRLNAQKLYNVSRKEQKEKVHGFFTKFEVGYKFIQGVYFHLALGWQLTRR